jgi:hypothetical protein
MCILLLQQRCVGVSKLASKATAITVIEASKVLQTRNPTYPAILASVVDMSKTRYLKDQ